MYTRLWGNSSSRGLLDPMWTAAVFLKSILLTHTRDWRARHRVKWKCRVLCSKLLRIQDGKSRVLNQAWGPSKFPLPIEASPAVLRSWKSSNFPPWVLSYHPLISPNCHGQAVDLSERVWRYHHPSTASNSAHRMCLWTRLPGMWGAGTYFCLYLMSTKTLDIITG